MNQPNLFSSESMNRNHNVLLFETREGDMVPISQFEDLSNQNRWEELLELALNSDGDDARYWEIQSTRMTKWSSGDIISPKRLRLVNFSV